MSLLRQSLQQWEWLIVNDGSTDRASLELLDRYRVLDPRIRVIDQENGGPGAARNRGYAEASTEYVVQLDADDLLEPTTIEKWLWFLDSNTEYGFVSAFSVGFGAEKYLWARGFDEGPRVYLQENLGSSRAMVRRSVHEAADGYDESIRGGLEDWDFWLRCAAAGHWGGLVPEYLDWYRRRADHSDRWENWDCSRRQLSFANLLRQRHPKLFGGALPDIRQWEHTENAPVREDVPAENRLSVTGPRLLLVVPWLEIGGADKFNLDLVNQLRQRRFGVTIVTTLPSDDPWLPEFARLTPDIFLLPRFLRLVDFPRFLKYIVASRGIENVLISNSELGYNLAAYLRSHYSNLRMLDYCHSGQANWKNGGYPRMSLTRAEQLDLTMVSSKFLKRWMVNRGGDETRIEVVHTNVAVEPPEADAVTRSRVRRELEVHDRTCVVLFAGRLSSEKQPLVFAQTINQLDELGHDIVGFIAGDGPERDRLAAHVRHLRPSTRVVALGAVPHKRVAELMRAADLFFLPSEREGIALTFFEAMACGVPVVGADVGGQSELVTPDCGVLLPRAGSAEEEVLRYTEAIDGLLRDRQRLDAMGAAARARVEERWTLDDMGDRMVELIERAEERSRLRPLPEVSPGLGHATAVDAVELARLQKLASELWLRATPWIRADSGERSFATLRVRAWAGLIRMGYPAYRWGVGKGVPWLPHLRDRVQRAMLGG